MHQLISKKKKIYLFLFFFLVSINNFSIMNLGFPKIENIEISGVTTEESKEIEKAIKDLIGDRDINIQVDGGINDKTASKVIQAGANVLVAGSAIFKGTGLESYKKNIDILRSKA